MPALMAELRPRHGLLARRRPVAALIGPRLGGHQFGSLCRLVCRPHCRDHGRCLPRLGLRRRVYVGSLRWDRLNRAGCPREAEDAARWVEALDQAQRALRLYA